MFLPYSNVGTQEYSLVMNKPTLTLVLILALLTSATPTSNAAELKVAAKSAVNGFQASLTATVEQMNALEDEHAKNTAEINQVNLEATAKAVSTQATDLLAVANLYNPKIAASNALITAAKIKWESVNQVIIKNSFGFNGNVQRERV